MLEYNRDVTCHPSFATSWVLVASLAVMTLALMQSSVEARQSNLHPAPQIASSTVDVSRDEWKVIQAVLSIDGFYGSTIDGLTGPGTSRAIAAFQDAAGDVASGELTPEQTDFLLSYNARRDGDLLSAYAESKKVAAAARLAAAEGGVVRKAKNRRFSGDYGGQWWGTVACNTDPLYERTIAMRINNDSVQLDNFADYRDVLPYTVTGEVRIEDSWLADPGAITIANHRVVINGDEFIGRFWGDWAEQTITLTGELQADADLSNLYSCKAVLEPGVSEQVETLRPEAEAFLAQQPSHQPDGVFASLFGGDSGQPGDGSSGSGSGHQTAGTSKKQDVNNLLSSIGGALSGEVSGPSVGLEIARRFFDDPIFEGRSSIESYIATTRLVKIAARHAAQGIVEASLALGIKREQDIPQYLIDYQAGTDGMTIVGGVEEQDIKVVQFASDSAVVIKKRLASADFELSPEAKERLSNAYTKLRQTEVFQGKAIVGIGVIAMNVADANALNELNAFLEDSDVATEELTSILSRMKDLIFNFGDIIEIASVLEETEGLDDVELAKDDFIKASSQEVIEDEVLDDLEALAG